MISINDARKARIKFDETYANDQKYGRLVCGAASTNLATIFYRREPELSKGETLGDWCLTVRLKTSINPEEHGLPGKISGVRIFYLH